MLYLHKERVILGHKLSCMFVGLMPCEMDHSFLSFHVHKVIHALALVGMSTKQESTLQGQ